MAGLDGPIIHPPGQYTFCVDRTAYTAPPKFDPNDIPSLVWDILTNGAASTAEFLLCHYLLGGKLVCLGGGDDVCAIGVVIGIEEVGYQKSGFDAIDNDFSFNMVPFPYHAQDFRGYLATHFRPDPHMIHIDVKAHSPVGDLLEDPTPAPVSLPDPREPEPPHSPMDGYGVLYVDGAAGFSYDHEHQNNLHKLFEAYPKSNSAVGIPIIHCECEGSRIYFVCQAMKPFLQLMQLKPPGSSLPTVGEACKKAIGWLPFGIGKVVCTLLEDVIAIPIAIAAAPFVLAAFAAAWEGAQVYDDLAVTGPIAKQIALNEPYIVIGRWTWDAGHAGHTELHPVKAIQHIQLPFELQGGLDPAKPLADEIANLANDLKDRWCRHLRAAPPPPDIRFPDLDGLSPPQIAALDPAQRANHETQQRPEHRWQYHPIIDGCLGEDDG